MGDVTDLENDLLISQQNSLKSNNELLKKRRTLERKKRMLSNWQLYVLLIPAFILVLLFNYAPMFGILTAFKDYDPYTGFIKSPWVGFAYFNEFIHSVQFWKLIRNTLNISIWSLVFGFPAPIILALLINELKNKYFKKAVQTISYLPYFISTVVVVGMMVQFTTPSTGIVNQIIKALGGQQINFIIEPSWFLTLYIVSGIWQGIGWGSIIYIASLSTIDTALYEAAIVDGASRFKQIIHISIPGILPTIIIMLIFAIGSLMTVSYEKILLMYKPITYDTADVINTYVYRAGILGSQYGASAAIGLFQSVINCLLLIGANYFSRKTSETSLW
jgi:ABC-type polysaccharide transport system, permease component